jgi:protein required for attachment to host cells
MHRAKVLYVVADGGRACFLMHDADGRLRTLREIDSADLHKRAHELGRRSPGRVDESASPARHSVEPRTDPRDKAEQQFIDLVAEQLNRRTDIPDYEHLVIPATSRILDHFKKELANSVAAKLKSSISKDLTKFPTRNCRNTCRVCWPNDMCKFCLSVGVQLLQPVGDPLGGPCCQ